jgi:hypothetical protein
VIVRILGEGQYDVPDDRLDHLNGLDDELVGAIDRGDDEAFRSALDTLLLDVRTNGRKVPEDYLGPSELVLPSATASLAEVRDLLSNEGLIPGVT